MRYGKRVAALGAIASLVLVACGSDSGGSSDTTAAAGTEAPAETSAPGGSSAGTSGGAAGESLLNGEIKCEQQYAGKTVSMLSPVRNSENDPNAIQIFMDFWKPFTDCTGAKIDFQGTDQFEVQAPVLIQGGSTRRDRLPAAGLIRACGRPRPPDDPR
jgi:alpha-glucoside transport system substrate-binding protein